MDDLSKLLSGIKNCDACDLMAENRRNGISFIEILPKPEAKFMFIGRDPNPNSVSKVGVREGTSSFIQQVFGIIDEAEISEDEIYITDMIKCHWRTGSNINNAKNSKAPSEIAKICIDTWLRKEIEILKPKAIISFGEEVYQNLKEYIVAPNPYPAKLSATLDKSKMDAELYVVQNGALKLKMSDMIIPYVPLRHAGNTIRLKFNESSDKRWEAYLESRKRAIELIYSGIV